MAEEATSEVVQDPRHVIQQRLDDLQARREELADRLQKEMQLAMSPLDASIRELTWMLSQLGGSAETPPPHYDLYKRPPASQPVAQTDNVVARQFSPVRPGAAAAAPQVKSPKSATPVATNVAILKKKLRG